jgi:peptide/nickel transport system permease protein
MISYILRRILATLPVMAIVALFVFSLLYIAPGDPAVVIAGDQASPEDVERIRQSLGLDRPFVVQFGSWLWHILHFDLGTSIFTNLPVSSLIAQRIEPTLSLMTVTLVLTIVIAVPLGVVAAWKAGSWVDRTIMAFAVFAFSLPVFVVGYVLAYVFALQFEWLPVQGYTPLAEGFWPWLRNLILPAIALGSVYIALIARITRASMLEVLQQDYIRTARAKGLDQRSILFIHALKNAAVPIVTVIGIGIALLIGGAVVTESVFAIPGLGRLTIDAILRRDYPVIQGIVLLFSFVYVLVNLMVDLTYTLVDPRIRYCPPRYQALRRCRRALPSRRNCRICCCRLKSGAACSASCAIIRRLRSVAHCCSASYWSRSLPRISGPSIRQRSRRPSVRGRRRLTSGSAATCWAATSIHACSTGRASRSPSAFRWRCSPRSPVSPSAWSRVSCDGWMAS